MEGHGPQRSLSDFASLHDPETGRIAVYYGCADTVTGLAFGYIPEIIDFTKKNNIL